MSVKYLSPRQVSSSRPWCFLVARRAMAMAAKPYLSHVERTAQEPRDSSIHPVIISRVDQINPRIRVIRLSIPGLHPPINIKFLPGQWLDVHIPVPSISKPGGFTITSPPSRVHPPPPEGPPTISTPSASSSFDDLGYLELAIQNSPTNPVAAYFWKPAREILQKPAYVRVGGNFTWPPTILGCGVGGVKRVVLVAGGVGINPLMSIVSHIAETRPSTPEDSNADNSEGLDGLEVRFLYGTKGTDADARGETESKILFLDRLREIFGSEKVKGRLGLWLTGEGVEAEKDWSAVGGMERDEKVGWKRGRMTKEDLVNALGRPEERGQTVVYVCGVPGMTDEFVKIAQEAEGMDPSHVLCEKWW